MRTLSAWISIIALTAGIVLLTIGLIRSETPIIQSGTTLAVSGLALFGIAAGLTTWQDERHKARDEHARQAYSQLARHMMASFAIEPGLAAESALRADLATWASPGVAQALAARNALIDEVTQGSVGGVVQLSQGQQTEMRLATAKTIGEIRRELGAQEIPDEVVIRALFNDRR